MTEHIRGEETSMDINMDTSLRKKSEHEMKRSKLRIRKMTKYMRKLFFFTNPFLNIKEKCKKVVNGKVTNLSF